MTAQITHTLDAAGSYLIVDGQPRDARRVSSGPFTYLLDTTALSDGTHTVQVWAHDIANANLLSVPVAITVANGVAVSTPAPTTPVVTPAPIPVTVVTPVPTPATTAYAIKLDVPGLSAAGSGILQPVATITQTLCSAGSMLMIDGKDMESTRRASAPYTYPFDLSKLSAGEHTLQVWAIDIGNNHLLSNPVTITVVQ